MKNLTVKELRDLLAGFPDDYLVCTTADDSIWIINKAHALEVKYCNGHIREPCHPHFSGELISVVVLE